MNNKVAENITRVEELFMKVSAFVANEADHNKILSYLNAESPEYRSIAFESASMEIAYQDLLKHTQLKRWNEIFENKHHEHTFHVHIGLGWGMARADVFQNNWGKNFSAEQTNLIFDGIGYYHALYKRRKTIIGKSIPEVVNTASRKSFDQGVGRRIWYLCKGNIAELQNITTAFELSRQSDLWRGIGTACGYVGGLDDHGLLTLSSNDNKFQANFRSGFAAAMFSRYKSDAISDTIKRECEMVCKFSFEDLISNLTKENEEKSSVTYPLIAEFENELNKITIDKH
ncbi:MAG: DUF1702 family protein [Bacteroidetes bacterium]|nr:DUF1702 family protein [Bacteroidota bacterium]